jgi:hypothetical protein
MTISKENQGELGGSEQNDQAKQNETGHFFVNRDKKQVAQPNIICCQNATNWVRRSLFDSVWSDAENGRILRLKIV